MLPPKHVLSKTTYLYGLQCHKRLWLHKHRPKEKDILSERQAAIFQQGTDVGQLAQQLFPGGVDASPPQPWLYQQSVYNTEKFIRQGHQVIYEAAFQYEGILCAVDLFVKTTKGWIAYEVKSSLSLKQAHVNDAALQYFVISNCGISLADMVVVHLDKTYVRRGELELKKLFKPITVLEQVKKLQSSITQHSQQLLKVAVLDQVPDIQTGEHCFAPYACDFLGLCHPTDLFSEGLSVPVLNEDYFSELNSDENYPLHVLNLQSWRNAVPVKDGQWPYRKNVFQFNISVINRGNESISSFEYCLPEKGSAILPLIQKLIESVSAEGKILVCNKTEAWYIFEALKKENPQFAEPLVQIQERLSEFAKLYDLPVSDIKDMLPFLAEYPKDDASELMNEHNASAGFFNLDQQFFRRRKTKGN